MSLSDRLDKVASKNRPGLPCVLGSILESDRLPQKEKDYLKKILEVKLGEPSRVPTTAITEALRLEGFDIGNAATQRHRRKECRCYGPSPKFSQE